MPRHAREFLLSFGLLMQLSALPLSAQSEKPKAEQELARIRGLSPGAQRNALRAFLRAKDLDIDDTSEFFIQIAELRRQIAELVNKRDLKDNIALGVLAAIGEPTAMRRLLQEIAHPRRETSDTDLAESVLGTLVFPSTKQQWDLLARGAKNEFGGAATNDAIRSLKLNSSARARTVLETALAANPKYRNEIEHALRYIRSGATPMEGQDLVLLATRTAEAANRGNSSKSARLTSHATAFSPWSFLTTWRAAAMRTSPCFSVWLVAGESSPCSQRGSQSFRRPHRRLRIDRSSTLG